MNILSLSDEEARALKRRSHSACFLFCQPLITACGFYRGIIGWLGLIVPTL